MYILQNHYPPFNLEKLDDTCFHLWFATHLREVTYCLISSGSLGQIPPLTGRRFQAFTTHGSAVGVFKHDMVVL